MPGCPTDADTCRQPHEAPAADCAQYRPAWRDRIGRWRADAARCAARRARSLEQSVRDEVRREAAWYLFSTFLFIYCFHLAGVAVNTWLRHYNHDQRSTVNRHICHKCSKHVGADMNSLPTESESITVQNYQPEA